MLTDLLRKFPEFDHAWPDEVKAAWFKDFCTLLGIIRDPAKGETAAAQGPPVGRTAPGCSS